MLAINNSWSSNIPPEVERLDERLASPEPSPAQVLCFVESKPHRDIFGNHPLTNKLDSIPESTTTIRAATKECYQLMS